MRHVLTIAFLASALTAVPATAAGQVWNPPGREMPDMPSSAELAADWLGPRAPWFAGLHAAVGVAPADLRAVGEPSVADATRVARFQAGPLPVVVWSDRDGDGQADLIEVYRAGGVVAQLIDADYDGNANVIRRYDASGALISEERM